MKGDRKPIQLFFRFHVMSRIFFDAVWNMGSFVAPHNIHSAQYVVSVAVPSVLLTLRDHILKETHFLVLILLTVNFQNLLWNYLCIYHYLSTGFSFIIPCHFWSFILKLLSENEK